VLKYSLKVSNESEYIERLGDLYDPGSPFCIYEVGSDVPKDKFLIVVSKEPIDLPNVLFYIKSIDDLIGDVNVVDTGFPEEDSVLTQGKPVEGVVREVQAPVNTERQTPKITTPVSSKDTERIRSLGIVLYRMLSKDTSSDVNVERLGVTEDLKNVVRKMISGEYKSMEEVINALENFKRGNGNYNRVNTQHVASRRVQQVREEERRKPQFFKVALVIFMAVLITVSTVLLFPKINLRSIVPVNNKQVNQTSQINTTISINSIPDGAQVLIDGSSIGITPVRDYEVNEGTHTIVLKKDGYNDVSDTVNVVKGDNVTRQYTLTKAVTETTVSITSTPDGARVYIDGNDAGNTPLTGYRLSIGQHSIKVTKDGYNDYNGTFAVSEQDVNKTISIALTKKAQSSYVVTTGRLYVNSSPTGADVYLNGKFKGNTPQTFTLDPGTYTVKISKDGYVPYTQTINVKKGGSYTVSKQLVKYATINITTNPPYATIYINGVKVGDSPLFFYRIAPGHYTLRIVKSGYVEYKGEFTINSGETKTLPLIELKRE
jgi:hypothetical protein